jgi:2-keto-4-pentenoate hydratase/2-oxohepta-3-ene-1,7-dioic acid hydratase in catechol pathway
MRVQTHVNGELRQNATTDDLIFSIPYLLKTMSEGQTLMPGDVLATGTVSDACKELSNVEPTLTAIALARWSRYRSRPTNLPQVRR